MRSTLFVLAAVFLARSSFSQDGSPDDYVLRFEAPDTVEARAGSVVEISAAAQVVVAPGARGLIGWSLLIDAEGGEISAVTTAGTAAALESKDPAGHRDADDLTNTGFVGSSWCTSGGDVDVYSVALFLDVVGGRYDLESQLDAAGSPHALLRLTLRVSVPFDQPSECRLRFERGVCDLRDLSPDPPGDGGGGTGKDTWVCPWTDPPEGNCLGIGQLESKTILVVPRHAPFRRGDANADAVVDMADAVRIFMALFLGASAPPCESGADANDDGKVDISDGIRIMNGLFLTGLSVPPPGRFECGEDPTQDALGCDAYPACGG